MIEIIPLYATVDRDGEFDYVDIFDDEAEARAEIGQPREDGLEIVGVIQGYGISDGGGIHVDSADFYLTLEEAQADLELFR